MAKRRERPDTQPVMYSLSSVPCRLSSVPYRLSPAGRVRLWRRAQSAPKPDPSTPPLGAACTATLAVSHTHVTNSSCPSGYNCRWVQPAKLNKNTLITRRTLAHLSSVAHLSPVIIIWHRHFCCWVQSHEEIVDKKMHASPLTHLHVCELCHLTSVAHQSYPQG